MRQLTCLDTASKTLAHAERLSHVCARLPASRYSTGRELYAEQFFQASEMMSGTPLERAYLWVLACKSALTDEVLGETFMCASALPWTRVQVVPPTQWPPTRPHYHCNGRCEEIKKNRIFETGTVTDGYDLKHLKPGVMYYCLEDKQKRKFDCYGSDFAVTTRKAGNWPSHPRADVFYLTGTGGQGPGGSTGLTLVDITGATGAATQKRKNLADWIEAQEDDINTQYGSDDEPFLVRGVVLAPYDTRYNAEAATLGDVDVKVIAGADAFALLGALQQAVGKPLRPPGRCA